MVLYATSIELVSSTLQFSRASMESTPTLTTINVDIRFSTMKLLPFLLVGVVIALWRLCVLSSLSIRSKATRPILRTHFKPRFCDSRGAGSFDFQAFRAGPPWPSAVLK